MISSKDEEKPFIHHGSNIFVVIESDKKLYKAIYVYTY